VSSRKRLATSALVIVLLAVTPVAVRLWPHPRLAARIPSSVAVLDEQGRLLRLTAAADQQYRLWTALDDVSPEFVAALLLHEDRHFQWHPGVNPAALARAAMVTFTGGTRQGGSTLTMQLARLLYGLNTRSAAGKLRLLQARAARGPYQPPAVRLERARYRCRQCHLLQEAPPAACIE
jgi:penicillin-binding protein 1C